MSARSAYEDAGVDAGSAEVGLGHITRRLKETWPPAGSFGSVLLEFGKFANVVQVGDLGLAICTDGIGSKALIAQMMEKYDTIGVDCVAMNVNDLVCVGARPVSLVDYIAIQAMDPEVLSEISKGLLTGAKQADISITGGEIAHLRDMIKGTNGGVGFDLVATAIGVVEPSNLLVGQDIEHGDVIVGIASSGIHSNGLTLARHTLFEKCGFSVDSTLPGLNQTLGQELLEPTLIYVREALEIIDRVESIKAFVHITSDGFVNLTRVDAELGFRINHLPPVPRIFGLIQEGGNVETEEMYFVFNMGIGFCCVVGAHEAEDVIAIAKRHNKEAHVIGTADAELRRQVLIEKEATGLDYDLIGDKEGFRRR